MDVQTPHRHLHPLLRPTANLDNLIAAAVNSDGGGLRALVNFQLSHWLLASEYICLEFNKEN